MVTGFVFLTVERDKINSVADEIAGIDGISEFYSRHDLERMFSIGYDPKQA